METRFSGSFIAKAFGGFAKKPLLSAAAGAAAFWIVDFALAVSPFAAEYKAAFSIASLPAALVEAFAGGVLIALCVSLLLDRWYDRIPGGTPAVKAWILGFPIMLAIESLSVLGNPARAAIHLLTDTGMNAPRFLALGLAIGCCYGMLKGKVNE